MLLKWMGLTVLILMMSVLTFDLDADDDTDDDTNDDIDDDTDDGGRGNL